MVRASGTNKLTSMQCFRANRITSVWLSIAILFSLNHCLLGSCAALDLARGAPKTHDSAGCHHEAAGPAEKTGHCPKSACHGECCSPSLVAKKIDPPAPAGGAVSDPPKPVAFLRGSLPALERSDFLSLRNFVSLDPPTGGPSPILASLSLAPNAPPRAAAGL